MSTTEDVMRRLRSWFDEAVEAGDASPLAFVLATVGPDGRPTTRTMSVKRLHPEGLVLFMNAATRKGRDVAERPAVAGTFWWPRLGRQINVTGDLVDLGDAEADRLWEERDRVSRVADSIGSQGEPLVGSLDELRSMAASRLASDDPTERPRAARAYLLRLSTAELWTAGPNRLHERLLHLRSEEGWRLVELQP